MLRASSLSRNATLRLHSKHKSHAHRYSCSAQISKIPGLSLKQVTLLARRHPHASQHRDKEQDSKVTDAKEHRATSKQTEGVEHIGQSKERYTAPGTAVVIEASSLYATGRSWRALPLKSLTLSHSPTGRKNSDENAKELPYRVTSQNSSEKPLFSAEEKELTSDARAQLLHILATTSSAEEAWNAYQSLLSSSQVADRKHHIPLSHLHRLSRLISRTRPKTRALFLRHVSVLLTIQECGGYIRLYQWNSLIDGAGKGWRKSKEEDYQNALGVFSDMIEGRSPGATFMAHHPSATDSSVKFSASIPSIPSLIADNSTLSQSSETSTSSTCPLKPDVYTYTTLLGIAARTNHQPSLRHALELIEASGLAPNRITQLVTLKYFARTQNASGVRTTLLKMRQQNLELGLDGLNSCLWSYALRHRVDLICDIYRLLRRSLPAVTKTSEPEEESWVQDTLQRLHDEEHLIISDEMKPNQITFTIVSQAFAYQGDLTGSLTAFVDMLMSENREVGAPLSYVESDGKDEGTEEQCTVLDDRRQHHSAARTKSIRYEMYGPTIAIFRAIFLGFVRYGTSSSSALMTNVPKKDPSPADDALLSSPVNNANPLKRSFTSSGSTAAWDLSNLEDIFDAFVTLPATTYLPEYLRYWIMIGFARTSEWDFQVMRDAWMTLEERFGPTKAMVGPSNRLMKLRQRIFKDVEK